MKTKDKGCTFWGAMLSIALHVFVIIYLNYKHSDSFELGGFGGEIGDFESITILTELPVGELKDFSIKSSQSSKAEPETQIEKQEMLEEKIEEQEELPSEDIDVNSEAPKSEVIAVESNKDADIQKDIKKEVIAKEKTKPKPVPKTKPKPVPKSSKKPKPSTQTNNSNNTNDKPSAVDSIAGASVNSTASAPVSGSGNKVSSPSTGVGSSNSKSYQSSLFAHLNRHKRYPHSALINKEEGVVAVRIVIDASGNVLSAEVKRASKYVALNQAARDLFMKASPLPKPPNSMMNGETLSFTIPIEYDIKKYLKNR
ncbi:energy transducer TonB family protein [Taylorella equigenitalis]|uniref:energy transducer TonB family protein n=1 Tax=Taylorella equigenitalis TaxID=29575 RepID=UPI00247AA2E9|nr:energy transducer TonB [Taylorella equigenitalis]WGQ29114.1 energy transducer TonB [Taylorella equigenitalis]